MKNAKFVIVSYALLVVAPALCAGCKTPAYNCVGSKKRASSDDCNDWASPWVSNISGKTIDAQASKNLFLEVLWGGDIEILTDNERASFLALLVGAKTKTTRLPRGVISVSPSLSIKYTMKVLIDGVEYHLYFWDTGELSGIGGFLTRACIPDKTKADDLAQIIAGVAKRMCDRQ